MTDITAGRLTVSSTELTLDAVDGSSLSVAYEGARPSFVGALVSVHGDLAFPLDQGPVDYAETVAFTEEATVGFEITERVSTASGEMWAGIGDLPDGAEPTSQQHLDGKWREEKYVQASWVGRQSSVRAHTYAGSPAELLARLARIHFSETPNGVTARASASSGLSLAADIEARMSIPGIGWLEFFKPVDALPHRGTSVQGGELYEVKPLEVYEIYGARARTSVHFGDLDSARDPENLITRTLDSISASWR